MKSMLMLLAATVFAGSFSLWAQLDDTAPFPKDSASGPTSRVYWSGPKAPPLQPRGGIHHIYANEKALDGYETSKFPDGSVIVYDLLETKEIARQHHRRVDAPR